MSTRRTKDEMQAFYAAILEILEPAHPMTCRQIYYQLETRGVIDKDEKWYGRTTEALRKMRRGKAGAPKIPYEWIIDAGRDVRRTRTYLNQKDAVTRWVTSYKRNAMDELSKTYFQIWL